MGQVTSSGLWESTPYNGRRGAGVTHTCGPYAPALSENKWGAWVYYSQESSMDCNIWKYFWPQCLVPIRPPEAQGFSEYTNPGSGGSHHQFIFPWCQAGTGCWVQNHGWTVCTSTFHDIHWVHAWYGNESVTQLVGMLCI